MARARAKLAIARFVAPAVERSTYVLVASLALVLLMAMWRPMPQVVWQAGGAVRVVALVVFWTGVLVSLAGSHMLDGLAVFGVRQVLAYFRGRALPSVPFRTPGLYRLVRHPMMTGMLMTFWAGPTMTQGRLLLAAAMSGYIVAAVKWLEERDLRKAFGTEYERYEREVPMLLPMRLPATVAESGTVMPVKEGRKRARRPPRPPRTRLRAASEWRSARSERESGPRELAVRRRAEPAQARPASLARSASWAPAR